MLEKKSKKQYFDAHFHVSLCDFDIKDGIYGCSCAHSKKEWSIQFQYGSGIIQSYGIHPQSAETVDIEEQLSFLEALCSEGKLNAIGECGFDFFSEEYKKSKDKQILVFEEQIKLANKYKLPVVIHGRKCNELLFQYAKALRNVPSVLFHSFMGTFVEAESLLDKGINGYFSFGKQIFNNNKKVLDCVIRLPEEKLLFETDAPFQFLRGEKFTSEKEIIKVYKEAYLVRKPDKEYEKFCESVMNNAINCFQIRN